MDISQNQGVARYRQTLNVGTPHHAQQTTSVSLRALPSKYIWDKMSEHIYIDNLSKAKHDIDVFVNSVTSHCSEGVNSVSVIVNNKYSKLVLLKTPGHPTISLLQKLYVTNTWGRVKRCMPVLLIFRRLSTLCGMKASYTNC